MSRSVLLPLLFLCTGVVAFYPNKLTSIYLGDTTLTHTDITTIGILRAVASFFEANPRQGSTLSPGDLTQMTNITAKTLFQKYYGDNVSESRLQEAIDDIVKSNNALYQKQLKEAVWHCNGEMIKEANGLMIDLRENVINILKKENANFDHARDLIGQFLHIMQMFYSNTNWVEMKGSLPYYSLGIDGKPLYGQAPPFRDTCISCGENLDNSCQGNTLINNEVVLTSGYRSGQDIQKPYKDPRQYDRGKCSHGGPGDYTSRSVAALGGINKDSTLFQLSPHNYLHQAAAQAAINHTTFFFDDPEHGLRVIIGENKYKQLLQLKSGVSLAFAIDTTSSMSDDIAAVKNVVLGITSSVIGTISEPANYVISLFNDPASLNKVFQTDDGQQALQYLRKISVYGGGDCPETAMDGLLKALTLSSPNSKLYFFSDASAKDASKSSSVLSVANLKNIPIEFLLTGDCGGKKRSTDENVSRHKRSANGQALYRSLAEATGGSLYVTTKSGIAKVAEIIKESVATSSVTILKQTVPVSSVYNQSIPIDQTVRQATIKIVTRNGYSSIYILQSPNDTKPQTTVNDLGSGIKVIKIEVPIAGIWRLIRQDSYPWDVEVTAQSTLDITTKFVKKDPDTGFDFEINGRPVAGENITLLITLSSAEFVGSVDSVLLMDSAGMELARHTTLTRVTALTYRTTFSLPGEGFTVAISATDKAGNKVVRLQTRRIVPVNIDLTVLPINGSLYINEDTFIPFVVTNKGDAESGVTVTIKDDQGFVMAPVKLTFTLKPNQNATGEFRLHAGSSVGVTTTLTISAAATSSATLNNFQYEVIRLFAMKRIIKKVDNKIPVTMLDPCTCDQYNWMGTADLGDEGFGLYQVIASIPHAGSFEHDNFTQGHTIDNGTISATVRSDCCSALTYITVVDLAGNTGQCVFDLAPGLDKPLHECIPPEVDNEIPVCNITSIMGQCDVTMLNPCTCDQYNWTGTADIGDEGFGLYQITASINSTATLEHDQFTEGHTIDNGTVSATIKSDCCNALAYITVVDLANNTGQCVLDLAPGLDKPQDECSSDNKIPVCNVTSVTGHCDVTMLDPCTCDQYNWTGTADIGDEGFGLYQITASIKQTGSFEHDKFTQGHTIDDGTISATVRSDCCSAMAYITVVDLASNSGQCMFDLAPGLDKSQHECKTSGSNFFDSKENRVIVGVVIAAVAVIIFVVVAIVVRKKKKAEAFSM